MDTEKSSLRSPESGTTDEDATLDIVRLLVETESRRADQQSSGPAQASYIAATGQQPAEEAVARPKPKRSFRRNHDGATRARPEATDVCPTPDPLPEVEDLRPKKLGFAAPRFKLTVPKLGKRKAGQQSAQPKSPRLDVLRETDWAQYGKLAGLVAIGFVIVFKPWVIPLILFVLIWLSLIVFLLLGSARVSDVFANVWSYWRDEHPERAERILTGLQRAADRLDGLLARLPERLVDGIYSPDLGRSQRDMGEADTQVLGADPFDRLASHHTPQHGPAE